jgi:hypothetical protein
MTMVSVRHSASRLPGQVRRGQHQCVGKTLLYNRSKVPGDRIKNLRGRFWCLSRNRMAGGWHSEGDGRFRL